MSEHAVQLEEARLHGITVVEDYPSFHERHRIFPAIFENRQHRRIFDSSAGVGCVAQRILSHYPADLICNDISPTALSILHNMGVPTVSFSLDDEKTGFPFPDGRFDAVISLATIEHLVHIDHFVQEVRRVLHDDGCFYISTPNYAGLLYLPRYLFAGRSFHNPLAKSGNSRYEFYAHFRYFTYRTLVEYVSSFGFTPDTVYLALPQGSTYYLDLYRRSRLKALAFRYGMWCLYTLLSPRWASEPVICFRKSTGAVRRTRRKVVL